jgi:FlaA1/EpsC-like NDP-sugar epimerase
MEVPIQRRIHSHLWDGFLPETTDPLSGDELAYFAGKRVLITGGGGYLGSALAHALCELSITELVLLDQAEYGLYRFGQAFRATEQTPRILLTVGSVRDRRLLDELFVRHKPDIVFHVEACTAHAEQCTRGRRDQRVWYGSGC